MKRDTSHQGTSVERRQEEWHSQDSLLSRVPVHQLCTCDKSRLVATLDYTHHLYLLYLDTSQRISAVYIFAHYVPLWLPASLFEFIPQHTEAASATVTAPTLYRRRITSEA